MKQGGRDVARFCIRLCGVAMCGASRIALTQTCFGELAQHGMQPKVSRRDLRHERTATFEPREMRARVLKRFARLQHAQIEHIEHGDAFEKRYDFAIELR